VNRVSADNYGAAGTPKSPTRRLEEGVAAGRALLGLTYAMTKAESCQDENGAVLERALLEQASVST